MMTRSTSRPSAPPGVPRTLVTPAYDIGTYAVPATLGGRRCRYALTPILAGPAPLQLLWMAGWSTLWGINALAGNTEVIRRCRSRMRIAATIDVIRFGPHWALPKKLLQDASRSFRLGRGPRRHPAGGLLGDCAFCRPSGSAVRALWASPASVIVNTTPETSLIIRRRTVAVCPLISPSNAVTAVAMDPVGWGAHAIRGHDAAARAPSRPVRRPCDRGTGPRPRLLRSGSGPPAPPRGRTRTVSPRRR
ncbi:hypothetical protein SMA5143A_5430 [Streptomyces sp. MA5143a]|nr:hypothetical protein SMA5143A_5430 [Streptomyces sp. MA5143a]